MATPQYLGFQFLPEDRPGILAALDAHPSAARTDPPDGVAGFHITIGDSTCAIDVGSDHGTVEYVAGEGDAAAVAAQDALADAGAVFTTCC